MSDLIFKNIAFKNFLSVGNVEQTIDLSGKNILTLVRGLDLDITQDDDAEARNGTGKTTIINAISYGLFGFPISDINLPKLVNNANKKNMQVTIEFERFGNQYRIERGKKPDYFRYFVNNQGGDVEEQETQGTKKSTQDIISQDVLKFSYNMLKNVIILNTYTSPFLKTPAKQQREIIEELFGITLLTTKSEILKAQVKTTKELIEKEEIEIKAFQTANNKIEKQINDAELNVKNWNNEHNKKLSELTKIIEKLQDIDFTDELSKFDQLEEYNENVKKIDHEIKSLQHTIDQTQNKKVLCDRELQMVKNAINTNNEKQIQQLLNERKRIDNEKLLIIDKKTEAENELHNLEHQLSDPDHLDCKTCGQNLKGTDHQKTVVHKIEAHLTRTQNEINSHQTSINQITKRINNIDIEVNNIVENQRILKEKADTDITTISKKISEYNEIITEKTETLKEFKNALKNYTPPVKPLFSSKDEVYKTRSYYDQTKNNFVNEENKSNPHTNTLNKFKETLNKISYANLNDLTNLKNHQEFLVDLLTKKDSVVRKRLIDQNLLFLNKRLNYWLEKLSLPHEVSFQNDLSVLIMDLGRDLDFDQLSRGQQNRITIGLYLAFRDIFEYLNGQINLVVVDEVVDAAMDPLGVECSINVLKYLSRQNKNVFLISNRDEIINRVDNRLLAQRSKGFTEYIKD